MEYCKNIPVFSLLLLVSAAAPPQYGKPNGLGEYGKYFEGDMILTNAQREAISQATGNRNGLGDVSKRWPNRTVVYHIVKKDFYNYQIKMIEKGMADIADKSCLRFRQRQYKDEYSVFIQGTESGCFAHVGFNGQDINNDGAYQVLNLGPDCFVHGIVVHEMLHSIGFIHMQSTYNRDNFVEIVWENIQKGTEDNFQKYNNDTITDFGVPYDYGSVMHYAETAFSKNGRRTIIPLQENVKIGQRYGLSKRDIIKLNKMYCEESDTQWISMYKRDRQTPNLLPN